MSDTEAWVSLELWDNSLEECLVRWNQNKWGLPKDHKANIKEIFFYGLMEKFEGSTEIFCFTEGYIFLKLKDKTKIPPANKIHGALDWVTIGPRESGYPVTYFPEYQINDMKKSVENKVASIMDSLKEGSRIKVLSGLYRGMEGLIVNKEGIFLELEFYLNSRTFTAKLPFWFTKYHHDE